jgi:hypothetical protein
VDSFSMSRYECGRNLRANTLRTKTPQATPFLVTIFFGFFWGEVSKKVKQSVLKDLEEKGPACAGPIFFGIGVRSETGYCQHGKSRSWWIAEFPETVSVLPTSEP